MSRIIIKKEDSNRVLLTELLPYETPMLFSNKGLYDLLNQGSEKHFFNRIIQLKQSAKKGSIGFGIPFDYEINKTIPGKTRTLSIIHPLNQINFIDFYEKYDALIIHLCSKSPFTLRRPNKIAKYCYSPELVFKNDTAKGDNVEVEPNILNQETPVFKSYFSYRKIDLIYKFYERNEFQRLEQRFNYLQTFDISKCFYNIYTHSVTWAIKGKEQSKRNIGLKSFENDFDKMMQEANYNETNGIVVGPEISRIFAEIILQQVDMEVLQDLKKKGCQIGVDFEIRRYIDDYFVFSNQNSILSFAFDCFRKQLEKYKLYLNPSKTDKKSIPFISDIAVGKIEIRKLLNKSYQDLYYLQESNSESDDKEGVKVLKQITKPYSISKSIVKDFQCITKRNNLEYHILSKDLVRHVKNNIISFFKRKNVSNDIENTTNFFLLSLDVLFYAYSLHINSSSTFKVSKIIVLLCKYYNDKDEQFKNIIFAKIFRETKFIIDIYINKSNNNEYSIDILNLLISLTKLGDKYTLSEKRVRNIFQTKNKAGIYTFYNFNYFHIVSLLYYIGNNPKLLNLKNEIQNYVENIYLQEFDPFSKSEYTLLFFDYLNCPYVENVSKRKIVLKSKYTKTNALADTLINDVMNHKKWFMDWSKSIDLEKVLKAKEWGKSY